MFLMAVITFAIIVFSSKSNMSYRVFHDHVVDLNSSNQIPELAEYEHVVLSNYSIDSLDYPNPNNDGTYRFCVYIIRKNGEHGERIDLIVNKSRKYDHNYGQKINVNEDDIECCRKSLIASAKTPKNILPKRRKIFCQNAEKS